MNLILDFGNSYQKAAVVADGEIIHLLSRRCIDRKTIREIENRWDIQKVILSSVVCRDEWVDNYFSNRCRFIRFSSDTPVPIKNDYQTTSSLGSDRLACAAAAHALFEENDVLVLQLGTCITSDFVTKDGIYQGGSISPGLEMRFASLHHFSAKLPLVEYKEIDYVVGRSTQDSILSGVVNGVLAECNYFIAQHKKNSPSLKIILTGGNLSEIEHTIKDEIVAFPNLVIFGLNLILEYNVEK
jgi:type III pantothenate kinase